MQWVVGQEYRTRDGKPAVILEIMPDGMMFGRVQYPSGRWSANRWQPEGADADGDDAFDLLPPRPPVDVSDAVVRAGWDAISCGDAARWERQTPATIEQHRKAYAAAISAYLAEREAPDA